ncbi:gamma-glutamylcyclotransferase [Paenibacillus sp. TAB 01]|uniref:gamma-glutamylcyclotransferase family protein n=1 Tax=Paenibacillus sp. TAB 01 TaxID=3368988 RepID=UPI00375289E2
MVWVFVYGTLLAGEDNHPVAASYAARIEPGSVRGTLYDCGPYPGLVPNVNGGRVYGEWLHVTEEGLAAMDMLEEYYGPGACNDYERVLLRDAETAREGWGYVWNDSRGCPPIPGGSWRRHRNSKRA